MVLLAFPSAMKQPAQQCRLDGKSSSGQYISDLAPN